MQIRQKNITVDLKERGERQAKVEKPWVRFLAVFIA
jgi:hypothetical protein